MKISEIVRTLLEIQIENGDMECVMLTGKWADCRSKDWVWPKINEIQLLAFQSPAQVALCSLYGEGKGFGM
jgi:hypothetical protein